MTFSCLWTLTSALFRNATRITRCLKLRDEQGNRMLAIDVFAAAIKFLKEQLFEQLTTKISYIDETDIHWVITVPAIWQYSAKQFMKEASLQAGIPADQFSFALEPEAAAIFCKRYEASRCEDEDDKATIQTFPPGSQFIVLDLGGGTADITASEIQRDGVLKELYPPSGGPWGGTFVDDEINDFLISILGTEVWRKFKSEEKTDYLELAVILEMKKRQCKAKSSSEIRISLPHSLMTLYQTIEGVGLKGIYTTPKFVKTVKVVKDKLRFENNEFAKLFEKPKLQLLEHLQELFDKPEFKKVSMLMMVGGFSESPVIQKAVMEAFPNKHVIIPQEAGTVVMKGAVMYGFKKSEIHSRKLPFSYGISKAVPYDPRKHPPGLKYAAKVEDVFHQFVKKGQTVFQGETKVQHSFMTPNYREANVAVYQTPADIIPDPSFVYGSEFEQIGDLHLITEKSGRQQIDVTMTFGGVELEVEAKEHETENKVAAKFDFLT